MSVPAFNSTAFGGTAPTFNAAQPPALGIGSQIGSQQPSQSGGSGPFGAFSSFQNGAPFGETSEVIADSKKWFPVAEPMNLEAAISLRMEIMQYAGTTCTRAICCPKSRPWIL